MMNATMRAQAACVDFNTEPYLQADIMEAGAKSVSGHRPKGPSFVLDKMGKVSILSSPKALQWFCSAVPKWLNALKTTWSSCSNEAAFCA